MDRVRTPWLLVVMHNPFYNSNADHHDEDATLLAKRSFEAIFRRHKVDCVFSGHVHSYERFNEVFDGQLDGEGPVYINVGAVGIDSENEWKYLSSLSAHHDSHHFGYGTVSLINASHALFQWWANKKEGGSRLADQKYIHSKHAWSRPWALHLAK